MSAGETESFGVLLRHLRLAAGLSQEALAERAHVSIDAIGALERGRRASPRPETLGLLADALDLSPADRDRLASAVSQGIPRAHGSTEGLAPDDAETSSPTPDVPIPNNLPVSLTSFVGRSRELNELAQLLRTRTDGPRLITLTGAGGSGKTRLALQVAASLIADSVVPGGRSPELFADGIWLVELADLDDPDYLPYAIAAAVGVPEEPGRPIATTLAEALGSRRALLLIDGCEHVVVPCAQLVDLLLRSGPGLRILATSRETLGVAGEVVWSVPALSIPPAPPDNGKTSQLVEYEAIQLFVDRAALVRPGFTLTADNALAIAEICRQLDGNPLAIELAAARVKVLDVPTIVQRLDDRFRFLTGGSRTALPRQQTLQALVDWSYGLLLPEERRGFARLSVFAGGWTLEAAEAVLAGDRSDAPDVLDLLTRLVDKSLVVCFDGPSGGTRYQLLETLRHYGRQRLDDSGETATWRARHARYYLALLEPLERDTDGASRADGPGCLHDELDNLHAALEWALSRLIRVDERLVDPGDAERSFRQCLEVYRELGVRAGVALALAALAGVVQPPARAARLAGAAEAILENEIERGGSVGLSELRSALARLDYLKRDLTATRAWTEGRRETLDEVIATALVANPPLNGAKVR